MITLCSHVRLHDLISSVSHLHLLPLPPLRSFLAWPDDAVGLHPLVIPEENTPVAHSSGLQLLPMAAAGLQTHLTFQP